MRAPGSTVAENTPVPTRIDENGVVSNGVAIRPLAIDDMSNVRYIHAQSFRLAGAALYTREEIEDFAAHVQTPGYVDQIRRETLLGGFIGRELVATGGWLPADDGGHVARISSVFVRPMFGGLGIGRLIVTEAESQARRSGFLLFSARVLLNAVGFFEALGYEVASHGVQPLPAERPLPVAFMRKSGAAP